MIFCKLTLSNGKEIGNVRISGIPPLGYTIEHNGEEYRIRAGRLLAPETEPIQRHAIDCLLLTVEPAKGGASD